MADDLKDEIKLSVDASGVESGIGRAKRSFDDLDKSVSNAGKRGKDSFDGLGDGAKKASGDVERATRNMVSSLQRQISAAEAGGTATRAYQESLARLRGANMDVLRPYLDQLDEANRKTEEAKSKAEGLTSAFRGVSNQLVALASGVAAAFSFRKFIDETVAAQHEQAQLAAVLQSTGNAAGFSQQRLNDMATQMASATKFSAGEINTAQTRMLSYTGVVGEQFPKAMQAAANMAARMGMDLASASEQVGRALDIPSQGLTALTRQGFRFSEAQADLIEKLEKTGRTAEAQNIILDALESSYGGAAAAARDTLGGALTALQNNIKSLMTGEGGSITGLRNGVESINTALSSPQTRAAFQTFLGWIATVSAKAIEGAANLLAFMQSADKLGAITGTDTLGRLKSEAADVTAHIARLTDQAERYQESINRGFNVDQNQRNLDRTKQKIAELQKQAMDATQKMKDFADGSVKAAVAPVLTPDLTVVAPAASGPSKKDVAAANKELEEQAKLMAELSGLSTSFYADWNRLNAMFDKGALSVAQLTEKQGELLAKQPAIKAAAADQAKAVEAANKAMDAQIDGISKQFDALEKAQEAIAKARQSAASSAEQSVQRMATENEARRLAAQLNISQAKAIEIVNIKRLDEQRLLLKSQGGHKEEVDAIEREIAARKQLVDQIGQRDADEAASKAAKDAAAEWQKTADQINQSLTDALMRGFESGKDFAKNLRDTVVNMFKTMVLRPVISAIINPIALGMSSMVGGAMNSIGPGSSLLGMASNVGSAYNLATGGFGSTLFGNSLAYSALTPGLALGGQQAAMLAAQTGEFGLAGATATAQAGGAGLGGFGGLLSSPLGIAAVGAGLAAAFGLFRKTVKRGDVLTGTLGVDDGIRSGDLMRKDGSLFGGPDWFVNDTGVSGMDKAIQAQWGASLKTVEQWSKALGLSTDKIEGFTTTLGTEKLGDHGQLGIRLDKDGTPLSDQEVQAKIAEAIRSGSNELAQQLIGTWDKTSKDVTTGFWDDLTTGFWDDLKSLITTGKVTRETYKPSEFARDGEQAIDTLTRLGSSITATNEVFKTLGLTLFDGTLAGADLASQLIDASGGMEQFVARSQSYFQNFFSAQEQYDHALGQVRETLDGLGLDAIPATREQFRSLVESLDIATDAGRETFASLMGVADAFAAVTPELFEAGGDLATQLRDGILGTFDGGNVGAAMAETVQMGIYNAIAGHFAGQITDIIVQGVVNPMIQAAITGSSISAAVSQQAIAEMAAAATAVAQQAAQIMNDPAFQSAMKDIGAALGSISIPTVHVTASAYQYTQSLNAAKAAQDAANKAQQDAARAAEQVAGAWRKLGDSVLDEVNRIRGVIADDSGQGMAYWQSQLAIDTAAARAGDQDAAGRLTGNSRNLLQAAEKDASSAIELQRIRAVTAANLQQSAATFYDRAGDSAHAKELAAEVKQLREDNRAQAVAMAELQSQLLRLFKRWDVDGMPEQRQEVA